MAIGGMIAFHALLPDVARAETRMIIPMEGPLAGNEYRLSEVYCIDPECDCRRLLINVHRKSDDRQVATVSYGFDRDGPDPGPSLDPVNIQSKLSKDLLKIVGSLIEKDPLYVARLEGHYRMVKDALKDPNHPIHKRIEAVPKTEDETDDLDSDESDPLGWECEGDRAEYATIFPLLAAEEEKASLVLPEGDPLGAGCYEIRDSHCPEKTCNCVAVELYIHPEGSDEFKASMECRLGSPGEAIEFRPIQDYDDVAEEARERLLAREQGFIEKVRAYMAEHPAYADILRRRTRLVRDAFTGVRDMDMWDFFSEDERDDDVEEGDDPRDLDDLGPPLASLAHENRPGRNEKCPCGSGRKYKKCCGRK